MRPILKSTIMLMLAGQMTASLAMAESKPELTVYTYDSFAAEWGPAPQIKTAFEEKCDCQLTFVGLDSSLGILARIRLEGDNSPADVILGLDTAQTDIARGAVARHGVDDVAGKLDLPANIPAWRDLHFVPYDWGYFAFVYDSNTLAAPPASMAELIADSTDLRIAIQDARSSTPGFGLMLWLKTLYGTDAAAQWQALAPKIATITKGWSESYDLFLNGEVDMVLSYTTSPAYHRVAEDKTHYDYARFDEGHYMQVEVAAMLKNSDQPELARQFLAFLLTPEVQAIIPTTNWMYPAAKNTPLPDGFEVSAKPQQGLLLDAAEIAEHQQDWLKEWVTALSQ